MKTPPIVKTVSSIGHVIFSILQALSVLGAVGLLLATLTLSFLPSGTVQVDTSAQVSMQFNFRQLFGETWDEAKDILASGVEGAEMTEDGFKVEEITPSQTLENRKMALTLIPSFAQMVVLFFFFRFFAGICNELKKAPTPFPAALPEQLKGLGISLFFLAGAPYVTALLIGLITGLEFADISLELGTVLWGLFALALAEIFRVGATLSPTVPPFTPPFTPPTPPTAPNPPAPPQFQEKPEEQTEEKKDDPFHPNAF